MRDLPQALKTLLASNAYCKANLLRLTTAAGATVVATDADVSISAGSELYPADGISFSGARLHLVRGVQVSQLELSIHANDSDMIGGLPWWVAVRQGVLKNARVELDKAFLQTWTSTAFAVPWFIGYVSESRCIDRSITLTVVSDAARLNTQIPRLLFQAGCMRTLFDTGCGLNVNAFTVAGAVITSPDRTTIAAGLGNPDDWFALGRVTITSGANAGVMRSIARYASGTLYLSYPLPADLAPGDRFTVVPGCDKTRGARGCAKFANQLNYQGTPFVPPPETAI
ncbi:DUF2163 domain-containing protein [Massilia sp. W12]|uniref:DUF2163 domain-containing protein n=1 Tax=Massilia sp. W12 TaxID=3126507 RepID=UPI0030CB2A48